MAISDKNRPTDISNEAGGAEKTNAERNSSVGEMATTRDVINPLVENVIGIFGEVENLQALLRRPDGRIRKVKVGDIALGGRVRRIDKDSVVIQSRSKRVMLRMPKS